MGFVENRSVVLRYDLCLGERGNVEINRWEMFADRGDLSEIREKIGYRIEFWGRLGKMW